MFWRAGPTAPPVGGGETSARFSQKKGCFVRLDVGEMVVASTKYDGIKQPETQSIH